MARSVGMGNWGGFDLSDPTYRDQRSWRPAGDKKVLARWAKDGKGKLAKRQQKRQQKAAKEAFWSNTRKFCTRCGTGMAMTDFPGMTVQSWMVTLLCGKWHKADPNVRYCNTCGKKRVRPEGTHDPKWAKVKRCNECIASNSQGVAMEEADGV